MDGQVAAFENEPLVDYLWRALTMARDAGIPLDCVYEGCAFRVRPTMTPPDVARAWFEAASRADGRTANDGRTGER